MSGPSTLFRENTGSVNEKVLPFCGWRVTQIWPPCRVTSSLQIYKPSPRPLRLAWVGAGYLVEAFKNSLG